ncbi:MAG: WG repeat-containing protein [Bernardetiaceae bacterium]
MKKKLWILWMAYGITSLAHGQDTTRVASYEVALQRMYYHVVEANGRYGILNDTGKVILPIQNNAIQLASATLGDVMCSRWDNHLIIKQGKRYGLATLSGQPLSPMAYETIEIFPTTCQDVSAATMVCRVKREGKYGLLEANGNLLIRCSYDALDLLHNTRGQVTIPAVVRVQRGKSYGAMVLGYQHILPSTYEDIRFFQETDKSTWLLLSQKGLLGLYNTSQQTLIVPQFEQLLPFSPKTELALFLKQKKYGFLDTKGKVRLNGYSYAEPFREGIAVVGQGKKRGAINEKGKAILDFVFDALAFIPEQPQLLKGKQTKGWGIWNTAGKTIVEPAWERIRWDAEQGKLVCEADGKEPLLVEIPAP